MERTVWAVYNVVSAVQIMPKHHWRPFKSGRSSTLTDIMHRVDATFARRIKSEPPAISQELLNRANADESVLEMSSQAMKRVISVGKNSPRPKKARQVGQMWWQCWSFFPIGRGLLHHDKVPAHTSLIILEFFAKYGTVMIPQPPTKQSLILSHLSPQI